MFGPATRFAAGTGCYAREALPAWVTEPTDEQPGVDPWATGEQPAPDNPPATNPPATNPAPPNRSRHYRTECGADRGYPPGWQ